MENKKKSEDSISTFQAVCRGLDSINWKYSRDEDALKIEYSVTGESGLNYPFRIFVDDDIKIIVIFAYFPFTVGEDKRREVGAYLSHLNFKISVGYFEMDLRDGQGDFTICSSFSKSVIGDDLIKKLNELAMFTIDDYAPAIKRYVDGEISFEDLFKSNN